VGRLARESDGFSLVLPEGKTMALEGRKKKEMGKGNKGGTERKEDVRKRSKRPGKSTHTKSLKRGKATVDREGYKGVSENRSGLTKMGDLGGTVLDIRW